MEEFFKEYTFTFQALSALGTLTAVFVSLWLAYGHEWQKNRKIAIAHTTALKTEIEFSKNTCKEYLQSLQDLGISAPSYRLPTTAYANSFPFLLGSGFLCQHQTKAILNFYIVVETMNRLLETIDGFKIELFSAPNPTDQEDSDARSKLILELIRLITLKAIHISESYSDAASGALKHV